MYFIQENGLFPAKYDKSDLMKEKGTAALDPNHSHFVLVDNDKADGFGGEIDFRANLEQFICHRMNNNESKSKGISADFNEHKVLYFATCHDQDLGLVRHSLLNVPLVLVVLLINIFSFKCFRLLDKQHLKYIC